METQEVIRSGLLALDAKDVRYSLPIDSWPNDCQELAEFKLMLLRVANRESAAKKLIEKSVSNQDGPAVEGGDVSDTVQLSRDLADCLEIVKSNLLNKYFCISSFKDIENFILTESHETPIPDLKVARKDVISITATCEYLLISTKTELFIFDIETMELMDKSDISTKTPYIVSMGFTPYHVHLDHTYPLRFVELTDKKENEKIVPEFSLPETISGKLEGPTEGRLSFAVFESTRLASSVDGKLRVDWSEPLCNDCESVAGMLNNRFVVADCGARAKVFDVESKKEVGNLGYRVDAVLKYENKYVEVDFERKVVIVRTFFNVHQYTAQKISEIKKTEDSDKQVGFIHDDGDSFDEDQERQLIASGTNDHTFLITKPNSKFLLASISDFKDQHELLLAAISMTYRLSIKKGQDEAAIKSSLRVVVDIIPKLNYLPSDGLFMHFALPLVKVASLLLKIAIDNNLELEKEITESLLNFISQEKYTELIRDEISGEGALILMSLAVRLLKYEKVSSCIVLFLSGLQEWDLEQLHFKNEIANNEEWMDKFVHLLYKIYSMSADRQLFESNYRPELGRIFSASLRIIFDIPAAFEKLVQKMQTKFDTLYGLCTFKSIESDNFGSARQAYLAYLSISIVQEKISSLSDSIREPISEGVALITKCLGAFSHCQAKNTVFEESIDQKEKAILVTNESVGHYRITVEGSDAYTVRCYAVECNEKGEKTLHYIDVLRGEGQSSEFVGKDAFLVCTSTGDQNSRLKVTVSKLMPIFVRMNKLAETMTAKLIDMIVPFGCPNKAFSRILKSSEGIGMAMYGRLAGTLAYLNEKFSGKQIKLEPQIVEPFMRSEIDGKYYPHEGESVNQAVHSGYDELFRFAYYSERWVNGAVNCRPMIKEYIRDDSSRDPIEGMRVIVCHVKSSIGDGQNAILRREMDTSTEMLEYSWNTVFQNVDSRIVNMRKELTKDEFHLVQKVSTYPNDRMRDWINSHAKDLISDPDSFAKLYMSSYEPREAEIDKLPFKVASAAKDFIKLISIILQLLNIFSNNFEQFVTLMMEKNTADLGQEYASDDLVAPGIELMAKIGPFLVDDQKAKMGWLNTVNLMFNNFD